MNNFKLYFATKTEAHWLKSYLKNINSDTKIKILKTNNKDVVAEVTTNLTQIEFNRIYNR